MSRRKHRHVGSTFDAFLEEEGIRDEVEAAAIKRVFARRVAQARKAKRLTKAAMARRMRTSRMALDRLLDPNNTSVTLHTMLRAAAAVGKRVRVEIV
jgi:predicted thioesterase